MSKAIRITVKGRVQGVGFRPFIFSLADDYRILGTVQNNMDGVKIHAEAESMETLLAFVTDIEAKKPWLSKISEVKWFDAAFEGHRDFTIIPSDPSGASSLVIPIDAAVCEDCLAEMRDPNNFRYHYPFINCTQCGPRYTIISNLPYDRPYTSMKDFPMCSDCAKEYNDPLNRRHHAQPIACPKCGPQLKLHTIDGKQIETEDVLLEARKLLLDGKIVAIKGLGGYHLCCDATNAGAVKLLRKRKHRPMRPLAIMAASLNVTKRVANVSAFEESILSSPEAPIVLLKKNGEDVLAEEVAPNVETIGVMLPYTPLHHLLMDEMSLPYIIATSANPSGLPILYRDEEAFDYLAEIADYVVSHNREILHPIDDSVVECNGEELQLIRRSRGYSPDPITASTNVDGIVAFGGQMKNTFAIGRGEQIIIGPHIGEMEAVQMEEHFKHELNHLLKWTTVPLQTAVIDKHPYYVTRSLAAQYRFEETIEVQHHHAHMAGVMEENSLEDDCYGVILDGTGYGLDGHIWGFEIFKGNKRDFERLGHLHYTPLPSGDKAVLEPWRNAAAMLMAYDVETTVEPFTDREDQLKIIAEMVRNGVNTPLAGTCGRLYDAVSALLGICEISTYDGEAAIALSALAEPTKEYYPFSWREDELFVDEMLKQILQEMNHNVTIPTIAGKFQQTVVQAIVDKMKALPLGNVVLSGGSFHNQYLLKEVTKELEAVGFRVYHHINVPTGDGGLSYGQLAVAAAWRKGE